MSQATLFKRNKQTRMCNSTNKLKQRVQSVRWETLGKTRVSINQWSSFSLVIPRCFKTSSQKVRDKLKGGEFARESVLRFICFRVKQKNLQLAEINQRCPGFWFTFHEITVHHHQVLFKYKPKYQQLDLITGHSKKLYVTFSNQL